MANTPSTNSIKCPYCGRQTPDEVPICWFCHKRVKGVLFDRITRIIVYSAIIAVIFLNRAHVQKFFNGLRTEFRIYDVKRKAELNRFLHREPGGGVIGSFKKGLEEATSDEDFQKKWNMK